MSIDVCAELIILRPRPQVAAFMFAPENDARWTQGLVKAEPLDDGPLRPGLAVKRTSQFLGRRFDYTITVTDKDDDRYVEMSTRRPFDMRVRYELEDAPSGTVARIRAQGGGTGFFRVARPFLASMVQRNIQKDLAALKACLEA